MQGPESLYVNIPSEILNIIEVKSKRIPITAVEACKFVRC
jgi:hypothetical protein